MTITYNRAVAQPTTKEVTVEVKFPCYVKFDNCSYLKYTDEFSCSMVSVFPHSGSIGRAEFQRNPFNLKMALESEDADFCTEDEFVEHVKSALQILNQTVYF